MPPGGATAAPATVVQRIQASRNKRGEVLFASREMYLRTDIACGGGGSSGGSGDNCGPLIDKQLSRTDAGAAGPELGQLRSPASAQPPLCPVCPPNPEGCGQLPRNIPCLVFPDSQATADYLELFELENLRGIVFLQSVVAGLHDQSERSLHRRLRDLVADPRQGCVKFNNEHSRDAFVARAQGETQADHSVRLILASAQWYVQHLGGRVPAVVLSDAPLPQAAILRAAGPEQSGLQIMTMAEFLAAHFPADAQPPPGPAGGPASTQPLSNAAIHERYASLRAALDSAAAAAQSTDAAGDSPATSAGSSRCVYRRPEVLEAGVKSGHFVEGLLRVNKYQSQSEAFLALGSSTSLSSDLGDHTQLLIYGADCRNRAVHGDAVVVEPLPRAQWRPRSSHLRYVEKGEDVGDSSSALAHSKYTLPTARVVGIKQRNWRDYVVTLQEGEAERAGGTKVLGIPMDPRIPKIRFSASHKAAVDNCRIVVRIDAWPLSSHWPEGHFVANLGAIDNVETETAAILIENSISAPPFSVGQMAEMPVDTPEEPWVVEPEQLAARRDLRESHLIFSIDPLGCEDVDDALGARLLPNGNTELSVHIADVSYFVKQGSLSDLEARSRGTTVYLADRRYDMLPAILSANLCSLLDCVDRYAMSVIWELAPDGTVLSTWFGRTIIRSAYKLHYELAQAIHDAEESDAALIAQVPALAALPAADAQTGFATLREAINRLMDVARRIRKERLSKGALELESAEIRVKLDQNHKTVQDLMPKTSLEIHGTVAECMIYANSAVAKKIASVFPSAALLRHHPMPDPRHFEELIRCAAERGFTIDVTSNESLAHSLNSCVDPEDPSFNSVVRMMATAAMAEAAYFSTGRVDANDWFHYGLGIDFYTHFTSPIRRYADVIVHRQLMAALAFEETGVRDPMLPGTDELQKIADHINTKNRNAKIAQTESLHLFQSLYFSERRTSPDERRTAGVVVDLRDNGFIVYCPRFGIKGAVYLTSREGQLLMPHPAGRGRIDPAQLGSDGALDDHTAPGAMERLESSVRIQPLSGPPIEFHMFDHVEVLITSRPSRYRRPEFQMQLLAAANAGVRVAGKAESLPQPADAQRAGGKSLVVGDARKREQERQARLAQERAKRRAEMEGDGMYALFQQMADLALESESSDESSGEESSDGEGDCDGESKQDAT